VAVSTAGGIRPRENSAAAHTGELLYEGCIADVPDEHASRRQRFAELDDLQAGWTVVLRSRGDGGTIDAQFVSPSGEPVGSFANARRAALAASKAASGGA